MAFAITFGYFDGTIGDTPPIVARGQRPFAGGWAADVETGELAYRVYAIVDGAYEIDARCAARMDVAKTFADARLLNSGFDLDVATEFLAPGSHELVIVADGPDGNIYRTDPLSFIVTEERVGAPWPRIVIVGAPKSGSTYAQRILQSYFGTTNRPRGQSYYPGRENNLDASLVERLRGRPFVLQLHMKAHVQNMTVLQTQAIDPIVTWRNLGDALVSLDDHIHVGAYPNFFFTVHPAYAAMQEQQRYQFLIRHIAPWYVSFYIGWKNQSIPMFHYELLATDPLEHFSRIIRQIGGVPDVERLSRLLEQPKDFENSKFNVGRNGRSCEKFSDQTKAMLEDLLNAHFEALEELVAQLPWNTERAIVT